MAYIGTNTIPPPHRFPSDSANARIRQLALDHRAAWVTVRWSMGSLGGEDLSQLADGLAGGVGPDGAELP